MEILSPYKYPPLDFDNEIRLIVLNPSSIKETPSGIAIECTLIHVPLANIPSFQALSYRWGSDTKTRQLLIKGQTLQVTENLWLALCQILAHDRDQVSRDWSVTPRRLWVDAVCINQNDEVERNHQVSIMKKIYSGAGEVAVWLGVGSERTDLAMETLERLEKKADWDSLRADIKNRCNALGSLLRNEYFSRMWIVQEVVLARRLTIYCGSKRVNWTKLNFLREHLKTLPASLWISWIQDERIHDSLAMELDLNRFAWEGRNTRLIHLLEACQLCKCFDPRDKVYSLLGLASDCQNHELSVEYSKTLFEVYKDVISFSYLQQGTNPTVPHITVRLSQMLQKSFMEPTEMEEDVLIAKKANPPTSNDLFSVAGIWGGKISKLGPSFKVINGFKITKGSSSGCENSDNYWHNFLLESIGGVKSITSKLSGAEVHYQEPLTLRTGFEHIRRSLSRSKFKPGGPKIESYEENASPIQDAEFYFFETATGFMGIGPQQIAPDDLICQFLDCDVAAVLRQEKTHPSDRWQIIGRAVIFSNPGAGVDAHFAGCAYEAFRRGVAKPPSSPPVSEVISFYAPHEGMTEVPHISGRKPDISLKLDIYTLQELTRCYVYDPKSILVS